MSALPWFGRSAGAIFELGVSGGWPVGEQWLGEVSYALGVSAHERVVAAGEPVDFCGEHGRFVSGPGASALAFDGVGHGGVLLPCAAGEGVGVQLGVVAAHDAHQVGEPVVVERSSFAGYETVAKRGRLRPGGRWFHGRRERIVV